MFIIVFGALLQGQRHGVEGYFPKSFVIVMKSSKVSCICSSRVLLENFRKRDNIVLLYAFIHTDRFDGLVDDCNTMCN